MNIEFLILKEFFHDNITVFHRAVQEYATLYNERQNEIDVS